MRSCASFGLFAFVLLEMNNATGFRRLSARKVLPIHIISHGNVFRTNRDLYPFLHSTQLSFQEKDDLQQSTPSPFDAEASTVSPIIHQISGASVSAVKTLLGLIYGDRHYARFAALETIARVPYFSYISVLHLYETFGWFREPEVIKMHFAESWNELHHLLIMESLGGNKHFLDRVVAQHIAFFYYWLVVILYMLDKSVAYDLNMQVEKHAFETYDGYTRENAEKLKTLPAPQIAIDYYENTDPFLYEAFQSYQLQSSGEKREEMKTEKRKIENLYDVFDRIRQDEWQHAEAMRILQTQMASSRMKDDETLLY